MLFECLFFGPPLYILIFFTDQQQRRQRLELDRQGHRVPLHRTIREQCRHSRKRKQRPGPQKIDNDDPNVGGKRHERRR